jgi:hypothetical protein
LTIHRRGDSIPAPQTVSFSSWPTHELILSKRLTDGACVTGAGRLHVRNDAYPAPPDSLRRGLDPGDGCPHATSSSIPNILSDVPLAGMSLHALPTHPLRQRLKATRKSL